MTERGLAASGIDTSTPNVARIYGYLLGGKDNFAADRAAAQQLMAATPDIAGIVRDNRAFIGRAVRYLADQGVSGSSSTWAPACPPGSTCTKWRGRSRRARG